jgi:HEPN domain-containing protein
MEDKGIAADAIASAKRWLASAKANAAARNYDTALYSLEMAVEIALKALLFSLGADVPKTHFIGDFVMQIVKEDKHIPNELSGSINNIIETFNALVTLRSVSGYIFETRTLVHELKDKYDKYFKEAEKIITLCEKVTKVAK